MTATPLKTFIIYARADAAFKDELLLHLHLFVENGLIQKWVDSDLLPGEDWEKRIEMELEAAHLVIMLVSADALSSEFIRKKELKTAIEKKRAGSARVIPVLVRDCMWKLNSDIAELQLLPRGDNGRIQGVAAWLSRDSAWTNVCEELHKLIQEIRSLLEKEKETEERTRKAEEEARKQQEATEKAARALRRRDEVFWKKISEDAARSDDPQHQLELYESYLQEDDFSLHRAEAEEAIETIQAETEAAERMEATRRATEEKRKVAEAERKKREAEVAEQKRKEVNVPSAPDKEEKTAPSTPKKVFLSYSHDKIDDAKRLKTALAVQAKTGKINFWYDQEILAGAEWKKEIENKLGEADIIVLLLSPEFWASDFIWDKELPLVAARYAAGAQVLCVMLTDNSFKDTPWSALQAVPQRNARLTPISRWSDKDEAWQAVAGALNRMLG